jgi:MFS family permease
MRGGAYLYARIGPQAQLWIATAVFLGGVALTVTAPTMAVLIAGLAARGLAAGLLAGLGIGVLSTVYTEAAERERAFGLFALMWVVPSLIGPAVTSVALVLADWRVALAWPAVVLLIGRLLVSRALRALDIGRAEAPATVRGVGWFAGVALGLGAALILLGLDALPPVGTAVIVTGLVVALAFPRALTAVVPQNRRLRAGAIAFALVCAS